MSTADFKIVNSKIDEEREFLNFVSQEIWKSPELCNKEILAHAQLTQALERYGFEVHKHYFLQTAFKAEFSSKSRTGPTIAILLEYDALPEIGHACGHNLIAEAGLAAAIATKAAMEQDSTIAGKLVILGTPAEEGEGGKIKLLEYGAFQGVDLALMAHPSLYSDLRPCFLSSVHGTAQFIGKETHSSVSPWEGVNAQDAAVICYQSIALLRQQLKPSYRLNVIITKCGAAVNVISAESRMEFLLRTNTFSELKDLTAKVKGCIRSAAESTGCQVTYNFQEDNSYQNLITNKVLIEVFEGYLQQLDFHIVQIPAIFASAGSTDMGNVSHTVPSIHPLFSIPSDTMLHTKAFTSAAGADTAQEPTLKMGKAMALTALYMMRNPQKVEEAKKQFQLDLMEELQMS